MRSTVKHFAISAYPLRLCGKNELQRQQRHTPIAKRWQQPSDPPQLRHFSGNSRASRRHKMSIQRIEPSFPPDNSADILHNSPLSPQ